MHFNPGNSRIFFFIVSLKPVNRYIFTGFFLISVVLLWLYMVYIPLNKKYYAITKECAESDTKSKYSKECEIECLRLQKKIDQLALDCSMSMQGCKVQPLSSVAHYAKQSKTLLNICMVQEKKAEGWYVEKKIAINGEGSVENIITLFDRLQQSIPLCICDYFNFESRNDGSSSYACMLIYHYQKKSPST
jgi:hypothetical protein